MNHTAALRDVEEVRDHWWTRPGWRPGRVFYTWHLTFGRGDELHRLVQEYQSVLTTAPSLNLVPLEWHVRAGRTSVGPLDGDGLIGRDDLRASYASRRSSVSLRP